mgnify:CR=1 FL=1
MDPNDFVCGTCSGSAIYTSNEGMPCKGPGNKYICNHCDINNINVIESTMKTRLDEIRLMDDGPTAIIFNSMDALVANKPVCGPTNLHPEYFRKLNCFAIDGGHHLDAFDLNKERIITVALINATHKWVLSARIPFACYMCNKHKRECSCTVEDEQKLFCGYLDEMAFKAPKIFCSIKDKKDDINQVAAIVMTPDTKVPRVYRVSDIPKINIDFINGRSLLDKYDPKYELLLIYIIENRAMVRCIKFGGFAAFDNRTAYICPSVGCNVRAMKVCNKCGVKRYCCQKHQNEDWNTHKRTCKIIKSINRDDLI